jgi:hypothetical protein
MAPKLIYHDVSWSSRLDSNAICTGFTNNSNFSQVVQESNQYFTWCHDDNELMRLTASANLTVRNLQAETVSASNLSDMSNAVYAMTSNFVGNTATFCNLNVAHLNSINISEENVTASNIYAQSLYEGGVALSNLYVSPSSMSNYTFTRFAPHFGQNYVSAKQVGSASNASSSAFVSAIETVNYFSGGIYTFQGYCEVASSVGGTFADVSMCVDGNEVCVSHLHLVETGQIASFTGIDEVQMTEGAHTLQVRFRRTSYSSNATVQCQNAKVISWRSA